MKKLDVNGCTYAVHVCREDDSLPSLLMLHGFMGSGRVFDHLAGRLSEFCTPVTVDLLGHGRSEKSCEPQRYREERQVEDILDITRQLRLTRPFLYGYSMGGRLALKTALQAPELFSGLVLESAQPGIDSKAERQSRRAADRKRAKQMAEDFESFLAEWFHKSLFQSSVAVNSNLQSRYKKIQSDQDPKALAASLEGFGTGRMVPVWDRLGDYPGPVLLLAGSEDEKYSEINDTMVRLFDNAVLNAPKAGHRVHLDNPEEFLYALNHFLSQN